MSTLLTTEKDNSQQQQQQILVSTNDSNPKATLSTNLINIAKTTLAAVEANNQQQYKHDNHSMDDRSFLSIDNQQQFSTAKKKCDTSNNSLSKNDSNQEKKHSPKKRKKETRKAERISKSKSSLNTKDSVMSECNIVSSIPGKSESSATSNYHYPYHHHHHRRHHHQTVVQKTEKVIIETRKLSVVESTVQCTTTTTSPSHHHHGRHRRNHHKQHQHHQHHNPLANLHRKHRHHHKHHGRHLRKSKSLSSKTNVLTTTTSTSSSSDLKCHLKSLSMPISQTLLNNENIDLSSKHETGQQQQQIQSLKLSSSSSSSSSKKSHKKKHSSQQKQLQNLNISGNKITQGTKAATSIETIDNRESSGFFEQPANCDSSSSSSSSSCSSSPSSSSTHSNGSSSSSSSSSSTSSSSSSSSSCSSDNSDNDANDTNLNAINTKRPVKLKYCNHHHKKKKKKKTKSCSGSQSPLSSSRSKSSKCSTSRNSSRSTSSSGSSSCEESGDEESKSYSSSSSSTASSCSSRSDSRSNSSCIEDVLTKISVGGIKLDNEISESLVEKQQQQTTSKTTITMSQQQQQQQHSSLFSVDTILQQEQQQQQQIKTTMKTTSESSSSYQFQSTIQQSETTTNAQQLTKVDSCLSSSSSLSNPPDSMVESPISVDSQKYDKSATSTATTTTMVKKRDPAEERQRLRSYRIAHHQQSQNPILSSQKPTSICAVSCSISTLTTSTVSSSTSVNATSGIKTSSSASISSSSTKNLIQNASSNRTISKSISTNKTTMMAADSTSSETSTTIMTTNNKKDQIQRTVVNKIVQQQQQHQQQTVHHHQNLFHSTNLSKLSSTNILSSSSTTANTNKFVQVTSQAVAAAAANAGTNFLNPSFFVPGSTPTFSTGFHSAANFPTFHSAFMPTIFNQQLSLNNVQFPGTSTGNKTTNSTNQLIPTRQNPFFPVPTNHSQQQSQLTIFTSPPLPTGSASAALSPFSFQSAMQHSTLLPTTAQFSPSSSATSATTATPLLMPKSALNFPSATNLTFPGTDPNSAAAAAHSLMMFGLASAKSTTGNSSSLSTASSNTITTTSPPFILPRIVQTTSSTHNLTANANTTATVVAKSLPQHSNKSNKDRLNAKQVANLSPSIHDVSRTNFGTGPSITILPNTASPNTHPYQAAHHPHSATNQQHSPLSTLISPQTLLLLQSPLSTATTSFSTKQVAHYVSSSASVITSNSSKSLTPIKPATTTINIVGTTAMNTIMSTPSISTPALTKAAIKPLATNTNSVILTPNSALHQHLPYTLFSQPSPGLMQPISIQAPPAPAPSSVFGTPLLLSVISPTGRSGPQHHSHQQSHRSNLSSPVIIANAPATATTTLIAKNSDSKTPNHIKSRQSELKNIQPKVEKSTPKTIQLPVKLPESKKSPSIKCNIPTTTTTLNEIVSNTLTTTMTTMTTIPSQSSYSVKSMNSTIEQSINKQQQSSTQSQPDIMIMKSPQSEEFESLVRSVKDTIDSFNAASSGLSDVDDNEHQQHHSPKQLKQTKQEPLPTLPKVLKQQTGDNLLKPSSDLLVFPISTTKPTQLHNIKNIQKEMDNKPSLPSKSLPLDDGQSVCNDKIVSDLEKKNKKEMPIIHNVNKTSSKKKKHRKEKIRSKSLSSDNKKHKSKQNKKRSSSSNNNNKKGFPALSGMDGKYSSSSCLESFDPALMNKIVRLLECLHITTNGPNIDRHALPPLFRQRSFTKTSGKISKSSRLFGSQRRSFTTLATISATSNIHSIAIGNKNMNNNCLNINDKNSSDSQRLLPLKKRQHRPDEQEPSSCSSSNSETSNNKNKTSNNDNLKSPNQSRTSSVTGKQRNKSKSKTQNSSSESIPSVDLVSSPSTMTITTNKSVKSVGCGHPRPSPSSIFPLLSSSVIIHGSNIHKISEESVPPSNVPNTNKDNVAAENGSSSYKKNRQQQRESSALIPPPLNPITTTPLQSSIDLEGKLSKRHADPNTATVSDTVSTSSRRSGTNTKTMMLETSRSNVSNKKTIVSSSPAKLQALSSTSTIATASSSSSSTEQKTAESLVDLLSNRQQPIETGRIVGVQKRTKILPIKNNTAICRNFPEQQPVSSSDNVDCRKNNHSNKCDSRNADSLTGSPSKVTDVDLDEADADDEFDDTDDEDENKKTTINDDYRSNVDKRKKKCETKRKQLHTKIVKQNLLKHDKQDKNINIKSEENLFSTKNQDLNNSSVNMSCQSSNVGGNRAAKSSGTTNETAIKSKSSMNKKSSSSDKNTEKAQTFTVVSTKKNNSKTDEAPKKSTNNDNNKKKRRRVFNKTGFTKPRKRNKTVANKNKNQSSMNLIDSAADQVINDETKKNVLKSTNKKSTNQNKNKKKSTKILSESETSSWSSSESDASKSKKKSNKNQKVTNFSDSDCTSYSFQTGQSTTASSSTSSHEEDDPDYPIYMVTAPSNKQNNRHKKVYPIKSNPFIRPIPSKKYYQAGLYSEEFIQLHSDEYFASKTKRDNTTDNEDKSCSNVLVKHDDNSKTTSTSGSDDINNKNEVQTSVNNKTLQPILPFPPLCLPSFETVQSPLVKDKEINNTKSIQNAMVHKNKIDNSIIKKNLPQDPSFRQDFHLSFDIWYQYKYNPFPLLMSSANYRRVRQNVFVDVKPVATDSQQSCNCTMPRSPNETACGTDCINRMMYQECWPQTCPAKDRCSNQRIQRHHWSPGLERFMTRHRGWGIRTTENIHKGEFILEYIGEIVSDRLFLKRMNERYNNDQHHYCLKIEPGVVIDGYRVGNEGRFVNHSCEPNCEMQKWAVNGYYRICMFALRDIEPMEELFYDYNFHNFNVETKQICHCGSNKCRGFINGKNSLNPKLNSNETGLSQMDVNVPTEGQTIVAEEIKPLIEFPYAFLKPYARLPPNDPLGRSFVFVRRATKKIKVPVSLIKTGKTHKKQDTSQQDNLVEISYDPIMLKRKMEPLSYTKKQKILKDLLFMRRNFEKTRRFYLALQNFLDNQDNDHKNLYRIRYTSENGNGSDSESSTSRLLSSNCSIKTRGISRVDNDPNSKILKLTQIYSNICREIGLFILNKVYTVIFTVDHYNTNGIQKNGGENFVNNDRNHGAVKRKRNKINGYENAIDNSLISFTPLIDQIRAGKLINFDSFERTIISHIKEQFRELRLDITNGNTKLKKLKLTRNGFEKTNGKTLKSASDLMSTIDDDFESVRIDCDEIDSMERDAYQLLSNKLKEKQSIIKDIVEIENNSSNDNDSTLSNCIKNIFGEKFKETRLSEENQKRMKEFIEILVSNDPIQVSEHFFLPRIVESFIPKKKKNENDGNSETTSDSIIQNVQFKEKNTEEVIRCICGILREEGQMIQCDKCEIWQHFDCVQQFSRVNLSEHEYVCEVCQPRPVPKDIPLPNNFPNFDMPFPIKYYLTLESPVEKGLRIRLGDCVYIYRQSPNPMTSKQLSGKKNAEQQIDGDHFIETIKTAADNAIKTRSHPFEQRQCIIIRVQHLAIIESTGQRILFGHHYIWPSETYHEPTRKFYPNELLRSPLCEWAAMEEVRKTCIVLDPSTYAKGRPIGYDPDDVFICEMRVDRGAKSFSRIPKSAHFPVNTKSYAFELYPEKLKIKRTYSPHQVPESAPKKTKSNRKDNHSNKFDDNIDQDDNTRSSITSAIIKVPEIDEKTKKYKMIRLWKLTNKLNKRAYYQELLKEQQKLGTDL